MPEELDGRYGPSGHGSQLIVPGERSPRGLEAVCLFSSATTTMIPAAVFLEELV